MTAGLRGGPSRHRKQPVAAKDKPAKGGGKSKEPSLRGKFPPRSPKPGKDAGDAKGFLDKILGRGKDTTKFGWSEFSSLTDD
jgi:hypothetical protein